MPQLFRTVDPFLCGLANSNLSSKLSQHSEMFVAVLYRKNRAHRQERASKNRWGLIINFFH